MTSLDSLFAEIRRCRLCADTFAHDPRPVLRGTQSARILVVGQAPGMRVHTTGIPFNDPSGVRLREWMGISEKVFYDESLIALLPMAFCFPGSSKGGDLPPPRICAATWRTRLLNVLPNIEFTLLVGRYAIDWHLPQYGRLSITEIVRVWEDIFPEKLAIPHPSPRNNRWLNDRPWFEKDCIPQLRRRVKAVLA